MKYGFAGCRTTETKMLTAALLVLIPTWKAYQITDTDMDTDIDKIARSPCYAVLDWTDEVNRVGSCTELPCMCSVTHTDCTGDERVTVPYIPRLPLTVFRLNFSSNEVPIVSPMFLQNATNVSHLDLSNCGVTSIVPGAFHLFRNLTYLRLSSNKLLYSSLESVFSVVTLRFLDVSFNCYGFSFCDYTHRTYSHEWLETLCLLGNKMDSVNMSSYMSFPRLRNLDFRHNTIFPSYFHTDYSYLPMLTNLHLDYNKLDCLPSTCHGDTSVFPNLTVLSVQGSIDIEKLAEQTRICLPKLQVLNLNDHGTSELHQDSFPLTRFPSLRLLEVSSRPKEISIASYTFRNSALQILYLEDVLQDFSFDDISPDSFAGCPNLFAVYLSRNDFSEVTDDKFNHLFRQIPNLSELVLRGCMIGHINADMFSGFKKLQILFLDFNKLTDIKDGTFDDLDNLKELHLQKNRIPVIKETTFSVSTRRRLVTVNLGYNPFLCSCDLRWFQSWLNADSNTDFIVKYYEFEDITDMSDTHGRTEFFFDQYHDGVIHGMLDTDGDTEFFEVSGYEDVDVMPDIDGMGGRFKEPYRCENIPGMLVQNFNVVEQTCLLSPLESKFIIAAILIILLASTLCTAFYRYRWHLRLIMFEVFRQPEDRLRRLRRFQQPFQFDLFISYDKRDLWWVRQHLIPELEEGMGLKLCVHERDFIPGKPIVDNIADFVKDSKKVMMLFSTNFAKSCWCQFELALCLSHVMENDDSLLIVMLHDIPSRDLTSTMMAVMKTTTYIDWGNEPEARDSFWRRMYIALDEILPRV